VPEGNRGSDVTTTARLDDEFPYAALSDGFVIPRMFDVHATVHDQELGEIRVDFPVEVVGNRARVREVTVGTDRPTGVGYTVLRSTPVRDVLETACRQVLMKLQFGAKGAKMVPADDTGTAADAVRKLVGWRSDANPRPATVAAKASIPRVTKRERPR
jgi:hypothetical protein